MTIDEAIKSNENLLRDKTSNLIASEQNAIKLGKEALERIKLYRDRDWYEVGKLLPGETAQWQLDYLEALQSKSDALINPNRPLLLIGSSSLK